MKKYLFFIILFIIFVLAPAKAATVNSKIAGKIFLQIEEHGEAWYVAPDTGLRYYLGRETDAFDLMKKLGKGISNANLFKIEIGPETDCPGLDKKFANANSGKIFLQVESKGEAWYVNPADKKRYFLGRPADAMNIMRSLGVGISNADIAKINQADFNGNYTQLEKLIHDAVNNERIKAGFEPVKWNSDLSLVARAHSESLAKENQAFAGIGRACDYPMIHHEDLSELGFYNKERLNNNSIFYFSQAGENIALFSALTYKVSYPEGDRVGKELTACPAGRKDLEASFKTRLEETEDESAKRKIIEDEVAKRKKLFEGQSKIEPLAVAWYSNAALAKEITKGWMESPGHRENILHGDYDEAGVGVVIANGYVYATQEFIARTDCGFNTGPCCAKPGYIPYCFVPLECSSGKICGESL